MKTWLLLCLIVSLSAFAETQRTVSVTGDAEVSVVPDFVLIHAGIEHWDRNLNGARKENDQVLKKVMDVASEFKLTLDAIQVDHIGVEVERKGWNEKPFHALEGYFVRRNMTFKLKDLARFDDFLGKLLDAGVNQIRGVEFQTSELRKYRDQAREMAIKAASEKAAVMAKAIGQKSGKAITIKEETDTWVSPYNTWGGVRAMTQNVSAAPGGDLLTPGKVTVKASVSATFHLD
jgi:uncharacterized protein YggE